MKKIDFIFLLFLLIILALTFKNWLFSLQIIGGDWPYFFQEKVNDFTIFPPAWSSLHGNGLGGTFIVYSLDSYLYFISWFFSHVFHVPWNIVSKLFYFGMFLFGATFFIWYLLKNFFPSLPLVYRLLGVFLYSANTYILLVVSGGQMGIALAYASVPLVLVSFIKIVELYSLNINKNKNQKMIWKALNLQTLRFSIIAGILFAVQVLLDFRIAYITIGIVLLYLLVNAVQLQDKMLKSNFLKFGIVTFASIVIPLGISILLHTYWILPMLLAGNSSVDQLGGIYTTAGAVKFFSFAKLENTISVLHPNWPENIFGKIYFMRSEFLLLPLLAFSSLLFISAKAMQNAEQNLEKRRILFFALLGLLGAFLAKGANEPFGQVYVWLFEHVPGFVMFRDPTKWYVLIVISYSVLIPFSCWKIYAWLKSKQKHQINSKRKYVTLQNIFIYLLTFYFLYLIHPALLGELGGTLKHKEVPSEYISLKDKIHNDSDFYRTLWVPRQHRFTFSNSSHPSIEAEALFTATNAAQFAFDIKSEEAETYLSYLSVKYIIIPYDPYGEMFVDDRKYSQKKRDEYEKILDQIPWLNKIQDGKLTIYETKQLKDYFRLHSEVGKVTYLRKSATQYEVEVVNVKEGEKLIFAENYSKHWEANFRDKIIPNFPFLTGSSSDSIKLNSFLLPNDGNYMIHIRYIAEDYYIIGRYISFGVLMVLLILLLSKKRKV